MTEVGSMDWYRFLRCMRLEIGQERLAFDAEVRVGVDHQTGVVAVGGYGELHDDARQEDTRGMRIGGGEVVKAVLPGEDLIDVNPPLQTQSDPRGHAPSLPPLSSLWAR